MLHSTNPHIYRHTSNVDIPTKNHFTARIVIKVSLKIVISTPMPISYTTNKKELSATNVTLISHQLDIFKCTHWLNIQRKRLRMIVKFAVKETETVQTLRNIDLKIIEETVE